MRGGVSRLAILLISNTIIGPIACTLLMQSKARVQEKRQIIQDRITKIADMNHHVRNALAVVAFYGTQGGNATSAERVSQAVKRIEWTLREVLPRVGTRRPPAGSLSRERMPRPAKAWHSGQSKRF
jgi:hypothetical protein